MSDLAPLVFAVLCDKSNADMKEENDSLRQENEALRRQLRDVRAVKITGSNGSPVFARAQLEDGRLVGNRLDGYFVKFPDVPTSQLSAGGEDPVYTCSPRDFMNLEVRIGGLGRIECDLGGFPGVVYSQGHRFGICFCRPTRRSALLEVAFSIGPFPSLAEFEEFDTHKSTHLQDERYQSLRICFYGAQFDPDVIIGLIDDFEQRRRQAEEQQIADQLEREATRQHEEVPSNDADDNDA